VEVVANSVTHIDPQEVLQESSILESLPRSFKMQKQLHQMGDHLGEKNVHNTSVETAAVVLIEKTHQWDPNLPQDRIDELLSATHGGDPEAIKKAQADFVENSPYEEVRAAVKNTDGGEPANTVRAWVLGMIFVTLASGVNMFLSMRSPALNFPPVAILL
jgi:hypothetical protein